MDLRPGVDPPSDERIVLSERRRSERRLLSVRPVLVRVDVRRVRGG